MKILVTGGAGFIGSHIVESYQERADVRVLDDLSSGFASNLHGMRCELVEGSILDRGRVRKTLAGVDLVFHLAAMVSVPESMKRPRECCETNSDGTLIVLEEAAAAGVKKVIFSSSAAIYGNNPASPKVETLCAEPESPYALTKYDGEFYCRLFSQEHGLATACLRYFNVYGPRQNPKSAYAAAVPIFIERALSHEMLTIHGDGEQTRDFIFVKDVVAANAHFAETCAATGVFNVATGRSISVRGLAEKILEATASQSKMDFVASRPGDVRHSEADISRLRATGFSARHGFAEGIEATIDWARSVHARR